MSDEDPEVFQAYLNCVYIGSKTLEEIGRSLKCETRGTIDGLSDLRVFNICRNVTKEKLVQRFERFGEVKAAKLYSLNSSKYESPVTAKIVFATDEAGEAAIKFFDGFVLYGHRLTVHDTCKGIEDFKEYWIRRYGLADLHYDALFKLYLLADKLRGFATANMIVDRIEQFRKTADVQPGKAPISFVYRSTVDGSPLRRLLRNMWFYDMDYGYNERLKVGGFPTEFLHDMLEHYMKVKAADSGMHSFVDITSNDKALNELRGGTPVHCRYHQHDDEYPFCLTDWKEEEHCKSCKAASNA